MSEDFRKPFAAPPTIFMVSALLAIPLELLMPSGALWLLLRIIVGPLAIAAGVWLIYRSIKDIETGDTTYDPFAASTNLVTVGTYNYSRNPGYLGLVIIQMGLALAFSSLWVAAAAVIATAVTTVFVIRLEEEKLTNRFGQAYVDYCARVRRWI